MKKLQSLQERLFKKELSLKQMNSVIGGETYTGCSLTGQDKLWDISDMDDIKHQQSLSAL